jgi:hypothetical protein
MRIPRAEHEAHPFLIREIAPDFELLDAWRLPAQGTREEFADLLAIFAREPATDGPSASGALFWLRRQIGALLRWDEARELPIPGCTETSLRARLRGDLLAAPSGALDSDAGAPEPNGGATGFATVFRTDGEWAAEISNSTVHGVLQVAWVPLGNGAYAGQLGVYVKPRGLLGRAYLAAIAPFRHLIVYPALMRRVELAWKQRPDGRTRGE